ncbi:MAG: hypothetical protein QOE33_2950 [Acidobacteriota bacterium]|nr:hypothetical protein [Acidobacteriota bacterium]
MFDWQTMAVVLIVLAATFYIGRMVWARVRSMQGRGSMSLPACSGCDAKPVKSDTPEPKVLVQIGSARPARRR